MDAANLTKKIDRRNAAIFAAVIVIVLLLLLKRGKRAGQTIVDHRNANLAIPGMGDFNWDIGDINVPGISIPDLSVFDQQSSCGCSLATIDLPDNGPVYYAPAKVNRVAPTVVQYTTLIVAPPKPPKPKRVYMSAYST